MYQPSAARQFIAALSQLCSEGPVLEIQARVRAAYGFDITGAHYVEKYVYRKAIGSRFWPYRFSSCRYRFERLLGYRSDHARNSEGDRRRCEDRYSLSSR